MRRRDPRRLVEALLEGVDQARERRRSSRWREGRDDGMEAAVAARERLPFSRDDVLRDYAHRVTIEGREYEYVLYPGRAEGLVVHFSAFFGEWGDRREHRGQFQGHFHRLRMFWPMSEHAVLFLCDTFGADANGTYYKGEDGDFFVERAMEEILRRVRAAMDAAPERTVFAGSSMGATAALRFALREGAAGAVGVSPHIDLDLCAQHQGRQRHVAAIVGRADVDAEELRPVTREIRRLAERVEPRPVIVLQSMADDHGVHREQVLPLVAAYRARGGVVRLDEHATGGHTSEYATPEWFRDQFAAVLPPAPGAAPT